MRSSMTFGFRGNGLPIIPNLMLLRHVRVVHTENMVCAPPYVASVGSSLAKPRTKEGPDG